MDHHDAVSFREEQPFCSVLEKQMQETAFVNTAITSNAIRMLHAASHAGTNGAMCGVGERHVGD